MKNIKGCLLHNSDDWQTPKSIYDPLMELGFIDCFPFKADYDELKNNYNKQKLFINPPFSKMTQIVDWLLEQIQRYNEILILIPSRTDTKYFHKLIRQSTHFAKIYFIEGRLHFNESNTAAPFPTMLLHYSRKPSWSLGLPFYYCVNENEFIEMMKRLYE